MKIYLSSCTIQRPLDVFTVLRNKLEAEAVLGIIGYCDAGTLTLVSSEALVVDYFCTCDDRLSRKLKHMKDLTIRSLSPLELIEELET